MNFKVFLLICSILLFTTIIGVYGGEASTISSSDLYLPNGYYTELETVEVVYADTDGHFNIPFSDGSKGYCLEYMEEEAKKGDVFIVKNTSFAVNNQSGEDVGNLLKVYFVDYGGFTDDPVVAQHMIWHFTDDFNGWRVNESLVRDIKETAEYKNINDKGLVRFNTTHNLGYEFKVGLSPYTHHQDYWLYDYYFALITDGGVCNCTNVTVNNFTDIVNNYFNVTNITYSINNNITHQTNTYNNTYLTSIIDDNSTNKYILKHIIYYIIGNDNYNQQNYIVETHNPINTEHSNIILLNTYYTSHKITVIGAMILILFTMIFISALRE